MKTFLLNAVQRLRNYSQKLDAQAVLYDKSWEVFNESGDKELMIFRANNELLISRNGILQKGNWELLNISNLIIDVGENSYLLNAAYIEDKFLALKLDGTEQYMVMIETDMKNRFSLNTVKSIEGYLDDRYKKIEQKRIREEKAEQKRIESELRVKEIIKKREEEEEEKKIRIEEKKEKELIEKIEREEERRTIEKMERIEYLKGARKRFYSKLITFLLSLIILVIGPAMLTYNETPNDNVFINILIIIFIVAYVGLIVYTLHLLYDLKQLRIEFDEYLNYKELGKYD